MVRVIEDLVTMDLIVESALSNTHKRQLAALRTELRVQLTHGRKVDGSGSDDEPPQSPNLNDTFESMDSVNQTLMGLTADSVEASINQRAIIDSLKSLHKKVDVQDKVLNQVLNMLQGVKMKDPVFEDNIIAPQRPSVMLDAPVAGSSIRILPNLCEYGTF